jgi:hypothetical protein
VLTERISRIRDWTVNQFEISKEFERFQDIFGHQMKPDGVLTKPEEEIDPIYRGFLTAKGSIPLIMKLKANKPLSNKERQLVREEAYLNSLSGNYVLYPHPDRGTRVGITIDNIGPLNYITQNATNDTMLAYLSYWNNKTLRYKPSTSVIPIQYRDKPWIIFHFPEAQDASSNGARLYISTRPLESKDIDKKFSRISLQLGV